MSDVAKALEAYRRDAEALQEARATLKAACEKAERLRLDVMQLENMAERSANALLAVAREHPQ